MTDNVFDMSEQNRIREQASLWLARLDGEDTNHSLHREFEQWLQEDRRHRSVFKELSGVWSEMDILALFQPLLEPDESVQPSVEQTSPRTSKRAWFSMAAAATLLITAVILAYPLWQSQAAPEMYATAIGEQTDVELSDGSKLSLNTNSVVEVSYNDNIRQLRLVRGEVFFDVAHQKSRPFVVRAGSGEVQAVGTAFVIQLDRSNVEVAVTEGRVKVTPLSPSGKPDRSSEKPLAYAEAGQIVVYDQSIHSIDTASAETLQNLLSWRQGLLRFQGETLDDAISEFSRYSDIRVVVSDPDLRTLRIGGVFKTDDIESFLSVLDEGFDIKVQRHSPKLIYLSKK
ncbi:FecR family protein [Porticoccus sp. W117]|uniref:FecR family protein n=1 Tax=Porticoccus sp. W117 TaxID=3054777 RepID=UPI002594ABD6|nr:FecR family protein [Porticoccus sp. W117]MDM3870683.1 FecR family protein [Porticoccus sp. W117]